VTFRCEFGLVSGRNKSDCHFIAYRYETDSEGAPGESRVMCAAEGTVYSLWLRAGVLTGLWRSDAGCVYVSDVAGGVHVKLDPDPAARDFRFDVLSGELRGVFGLSDQHVWTWGERKSLPVLFFWNGASWSELEAPFPIVAMHGIHPELVVAVGRDGLLARFDGQRWQPAQAPIAARFTDVYVESEDSMYACSEEGDLLEGSTREWALRLRSGRPMRCIAKAYDTVWVGTDEGLMKVDGASLLDFKKNVRAKRFDARHSLLMCAPDLLVHSADGAAFVATKVGVVDAIAGQEPLVGT
jgi:hypothetical protein